jgi:hypothetical protein
MPCFPASLLPAFPDSGGKRAAAIIVQKDSVLTVPVLRAPVQRVPVLKSRSACTYLPQTGAVSGKPSCIRHRMDILNTFACSETQSAAAAAAAAAVTRAQARLCSSRTISEWVIRVPQPIQWAFLR